VNDSFCVPKGPRLNRINGATDISIHSLERKTVLVTGGAGYIGSHTCKALARAGYRPVAYDNLEYGHRWAVKWGPIEIGNILDRGRLDEVIAKYRPVAVMHFAAYAYVGESVLDPAKYYRNNVVGSLTLLEAMRDGGVDALVLSSTCATYGIPLRVPIPEDHPQHPINSYGSSKLMIERMLADFEAAYGMCHYSLRYFNAAGADPDGEIGEDHDPETHLIPLAIRAVLGGTETLKIFGTDYETADGTCIRDYIHVADLADAHLKALEALLQTRVSRSLNLGTGNGYSVQEVINVLGEIAARPVPVTVAARRPGDPPILIADAAAARSLLGWKPSYSDLRTILETAWKWHSTRQ
jgi:UDP-arabinose 4-epimerase